MISFILTALMVILVTFIIVYGIVFVIGSMNTLAIIVAIILIGGIIAMFAYISRN